MSACQLLDSNFDSSHWTPSDFIAVRSKMCNNCHPSFVAILCTLLIKKSLLFVQCIVLLANTSWEEEQTGVIKLSPGTAPAGQPAIIVRRQRRQT